MTSESPFETGDHRVVPLKCFDELSIGEIFRAPSRTITEANFAAFQTVSLDNHPIHYDVEYCKALGHPAPLDCRCWPLRRQEPACFRMSSARR